ncbi:sugar phosphate isomerase/epimerase [Streptomyces sp. NE06-03E]|uniref:Sugar phosphate isomerase/epimerase n=2 Tax=Streptomyces TaxID=1883 RepID=A0A652KKK2_9ACTN|nr:MULTISPECIES: sugar phosphate isomerase/epimerase family protein [unclassified Streptomyces]MDX3055430.1 sugar phosphate isomerase/epimerase [Streptomyces sp. NE06-03E]MDX3326109.1 sugar phosphate isomerase/epimerase [Streptomyces sp. ME02-6979-3A]MDX3428826.1 sugar phosphate isomerase/epimerase [Streptomyces sp. ME01-18a]MDX3687373.1 sugar phosphate isomerase/epimerase [Streptomyces sp. AK04-4c]RPK43967.1 3-dehydroshikimate dehydratase [Streptomyces sp. ADI93-02]
MKLAFSTLGVPGMPVADVVRLAAGNGYQGVELRAHAEEPVNVGLTQLERSVVAEEFKRGGVEILTVAGYARVAAEGDDKPVLDELAGLVDLAHDLGAPYVRVFPGGGDQGPADADAAAARRLGAAAPHAADRGVRILLETHDSHRAGADVARVVGTVGHGQIGAIWDVMHTWLAGEEPVASHAVLAPHLGYVQVKDIASAEDTTPLPLGAGTLPLKECLDTLDQDGWVCWEYEKRWYAGAAGLPELLAPGREHLLRLGAPKQ